MKVPRYVLPLLAATALVVFLLAFLYLLPLREPPMTLPLGEYIAGDYPPGIAFYQPSSNHYYATTIYDDFVIANDQRLPLESLPNVRASRDSAQGIIALRNLANSLVAVPPNFLLSSQAIDSSTSVIATSSTSATLVRRWETKTNSLPYTAGGITIKFNPADLLIEPATKTLFVDQSRNIDQALLEGQTGQTFVPSGTLPEAGASWELTGKTIIITNPNGAGALSLTAVGDQRIFINPQLTTIEFVTNLTSNQTRQEISVETWPTVHDYPWSTQ